MPKPESPEDVFKGIEAPKFERFKIKKSVPDRPLRLTAGWPRQMREEHSGLLEQATGPTKVRVRLIRAEDGEPLAGRRFVVVSLRDKGEGPVAEGITDARGYGAATVIETGWKDLTITLPISGSEGSVPPIPIGDLQRRAYGPLGLPHVIRLPRAKANALPQLVNAADTSVVQDPDADDVKNSPDSFGLNEEHIDGNCCLRPQQQFATREYLFRQIVRFNEPLLVRISNKQKANRVPIKGPVPFRTESEATYNVLAATPVIGAVNLYRQGWFGVGRGLGELLYSLSLAPCQHENLAFSDWSRTERDTREESTATAEQLMHRLNHDRSINEIVDAVIEEQQTGNSATVVGGAAGSARCFRRSALGVVHFERDRSRERNSRLDDPGYFRRCRAAIFRDAFSAIDSGHHVATIETERIQTRAVHNHNRNHAMTVQYFQVLSHYLVKTELVEQKPVLLVPYRIDQAIFDDLPSFADFQLSPERRITRFLDRHRAILERMVPARLRPAFEALSRLLHCRELYPVETPFATASRSTSAWIRLGGRVFR